MEAFLLTEINRSNDLIAASRSPRQPGSGTVTPPVQMVFSKEDRPPRRASNPGLTRSYSCGAGGTGRSGSGNNSRDGESSPSSKLTGTSSLPSSRHVSPINTSDSCTTSPSPTTTSHNNNSSSGTHTPDEKKSSSLMRKLSSPGKLFHGSGNRARAISDSKADRSASSSQISLMSVTPRTGHDNVKSTHDTAAESETASSGGGGGGGGGGLYSREANSSASSRLLVEPSEEQKIRQVRDILAPTVQERPRTNSFGRSSSHPFMVASMVSRTPVVTPPGERVMNARSTDEHLYAIYRHIEGLDKRLKRTEANNTLLVQEAVALKGRMDKFEGNRPYCFCCCCCSWITSCLGLDDDDDDDDDAKHILLSSELGRK